MESGACVQDRVALCYSREAARTSQLLSTPISLSSSEHTHWKSPMAAVIGLSRFPCISTELSRRRVAHGSQALLGISRASSCIHLRSCRASHPNPKTNQVSRRNAITWLLSGSILTQFGSSHVVTLAEPSIEFREHIDVFDGYTFLYPKNWIQVKGAGADIFFRDPFILDENLSLELSSPSSSRYKSVEDLGPPQVAAEKVLKQYLTEFMSTRLGVRRESSILSTSSRVADDGKVYYQVEVNIKSYASNNELAVMPKDRIPRLEWDRRYLSILGVENNRLYELRLQTPESVFIEEENDLRRVMDSFRVIKSVA